MATPHVAGAAGLYLTKHPTASWREVKDALLRYAKPIPALQGKVVSNGKLDVENLMRN
jgi:subtilisin family serine protease